jgi:hypothetical protein
MKNLPVKAVSSPRILQKRDTHLPITDPYLRPAIWL